MAAAPADFRASEIAAGKLTRDDSLDLHLEPTEDILASLTGARTDDQTVVAFAAEAGENIERAREKLARKKADLIVLNDISNPAIGFESQENAITLIDSASADPVPQASKDDIAEAILERVDQLRSKAAQPNGSPRVARWRGSPIAQGAEGVRAHGGGPPRQDPLA